MSTVPSTLPLRSALQGIGRSIVIASTIATAVASWFWFRGGAGTLFAPHHYSGATSYVYGVTMWQSMMVAMMTPAVLPWMLTFAEFTGRRPRTTVAFIAGYFLVWLGYSSILSGMQILLQAGSWLQHGSVSNHIAGLVLFSSGIFQFLPMKRACLSHCRNPLTYFMSHWKNGPAGGLRLGLIHGTYCLGCCWLLMMTGFAMGVMNMAGMALLTIIIAVEQVVPYGDRVGYVFGVVLAAWGCLRLLL